MPDLFPFGFHGYIWIHNKLAPRELFFKHFSRIVERIKVSIIASASAHFNHWGSGGSRCVLLEGLHDAGTPILCLVDRITWQVKSFLLLCLRTGAYRKAILSSIDKGHIGHQKVLKPYLPPALVVALWIVVAKHLFIQIQHKKFWRPWFVSAVTHF